MMSIGQQLDDEDLDMDDDDQEAMKRRVEAVWRHRQDKIRDAKTNQKSGFMSTLLSCGGGKSKGTTTPGKQPQAKPYVPEDASASVRANADDEVSQLSLRCTRILRMLIDAGIEIDRTEKSFGMTALDMAILNGDVESTALLVSAGGDGNHLMKMFALTDLYEALTTQNRKEIKDLINYDRDLDINEPFSRFNITRKTGPDDQTQELGDEGLNPLTVAVRLNDMETVKLFLKIGESLSIFSRNLK